MIKIAVVTGCASFLGTTFTAKLLEEGWYVYGIDKLTYVANDNIVEELQNNYSKFRLISSLALIPKRSVTPSINLLMVP